MNFFRTFYTYWRRSLTELPFYWTVIAWPQWRLILLSLFNLLLLSSVSIFIWNSRTLPQALQQFQTALERSPDYYPQELIISWDGSLLTASPEPVVVPTPQQDLASLPENLLILTALPSLNEADSSQLPTNTLLATTQTQLWLTDLDNRWSSAELKSLPGFEAPFTITASNYSEFVANWQQALSRFTPAIALVTSLAIPLFFMLGKLISITLDSLLVFLLTKLFPRSLSFGQSWRLSLHLGVVATLIGEIARLLYPNFSFNFFSLSFWVLATLVLLSQKINPAAASQTPKQK